MRAATIFSVLVILCVCLGVTTAADEKNITTAPLPTPPSGVRPECLRHDIKCIMNVTLLHYNHTKLVFGGLNDAVPYKIADIFDGLMNSVTLMLGQPIHRLGATFIHLFVSCINQIQASIIFLSTVFFPEVVINDDLVYNTSMYIIVCVIVIAFIATINTLFSIIWAISRILIRTIEVTRMLITDIGVMILGLFTIAFLIICVASIIPPAAKMA